MKLLKEIVDYKRAQLVQRKRARPTRILMRSPFFQRPACSLRRCLEKAKQPVVIAEYKRRSPARGIISLKHPVVEVVKGYCRAGAAAVSVLTEPYYFGGDDRDMIAARRSVQCPVLRKDFIISPYQVIESRAMGADVLLLIAAILTPEKARELARLAHENGMEVLLELYRNREMNHLNEYVDVVGINSRNLETFRTDIKKAVALARLLPKDCLSIAESGIRSIPTMQKLQAAGYRGFLIGEAFMKAPDPARRCSDMISEFKACSPMTSKNICNEN